MGFYIWLGIFITALFIFSSCFYQQAAALASKWLSLKSSLENQTIENFILSDTGECQFNNKAALQISAHSQINVWGYWLVFANSDAVFTKHFIFKDSLSNEDQARIARTILRIKNSSEQN